MHLSCNFVNHPCLSVYCIYTHACIHIVSSLFRLTVASPHKTKLASPHKTNVSSVFLEGPTLLSSGGFLRFPDSVRACLDTPPLPLSQCMLDAYELVFMHTHTHTWEVRVPTSAMADVLVRKDRELFF